MEFLLENLFDGKQCAMIYFLTTERIGWMKAITGISYQHLLSKDACNCYNARYHLS